ncbi:MAG: alpha/beta fold hydrolase [Oceanicoccus sp.]
MATRQRNGLVNNQHDITDTSNEALIDIAYSLVVEPHRLRMFTQIILDRLEVTHLNQVADGNADEKTEDINEIANHFSRAANLLDRQGRQFLFATGSRRYVDLDNRPCLLLQQNGTILHRNQAAIDGLCIADHKRLSSTSFRDGQYGIFRDNLTSIKKFENDQLIAIYDLILLDGSPVKMALSKTIDYTGKVIGRLYTLHIKWQPEMARQFQEGFNLTAVDLAITEAIVTGRGLRALAEDRNRSIGTVRNQLKTLLAKLELNSQSELICFLSGFMNIKRKEKANIIKPGLPVEPWRDVAILDLPDSRKMQYELAGPVNGRPVLYFHALIGGTVLTPSMRAELDARRIRLIMVWRPNFAGTSSESKWKGAAQRFAADVLCLLEYLKIEKCQILANITGSIYAYACAQKLPNRISGIINCGSCIPIVSHEQYKAMMPAFRVSVYMARYAPKLLPMFVKGALAKIDAGFDEEVILDQFEHSPHDMDMLLRTELKELIRASYARYTSAGYLMYSIDLPLVASKWGGLLEGVHCPVTLMHGSEDPAFGATTLRDFCQDRDNFTFEVFDRTGQLVFFQHSKEVFAALDAQNEYLQ